jgi:S1-C subfamily serine protease
VVVDVMQGSPAERGGLKPCDLIEKVGDRPVKNPSEVQLAVDRAKVGEPLAMTVRRADRPVQLTLRPAELPHER